jgi:3-oxoacid CoA-transferase A subunit
VPELSQKIISAQDAAALVHDDAVVMVGGFGLVGAPLALLDAIVADGSARGLTIVSNNLGEPGRGLGRLLLGGQVATAVGSYFTSNPDVVEWHTRGDLDVRLMPQGTFAEAIRAAGAGIGAFYTRTGVGTALAEGREVRELDGVEHILEYPVHANVALVRAHQADALGNLTYRMTERNFNPEMATAADVVIAQVDSVVPAGWLDAETIVTPHLYVDHLVLTPS